MEIKSLGSQKPKNNWKKRARREERQAEAKERQAKHDKLTIKQKIELATLNSWEWNRLKNLEFVDQLPKENQK